MKTLLYTFAFSSLLTCGPWYEMTNMVPEAIDVTKFVTSEKYLPDSCDGNLVRLSLVDQTSYQNTFVPINYPVDVITNCDKAVSVVQDTNIADETYDYDTTLKGGYSISFTTDDSLQYLSLKKGDKKIAELASTSKRMLHKNLGYVGADFTNYFVLVHSFGSGNPHYIELIKKITGKNVLKDNAVWIDVQEERETLLYTEHDVPQAKDKMILHNTHTGQKRFFDFPSDIIGEPQVTNRIHISSLTDAQLVIEYETSKGVGKKVYKL